MRPATLTAEIRSTTTDSTAYGSPTVTVVLMFGDVAVQQWTVAVVHLPGTRKERVAFLDAFIADKLARMLHVHTY